MQEHILARVKEAKFFSVLADGTTDVHKHEQFSIVLRYYYRGRLYEDFVEYVDVSGEFLELLFISSVNTQHATFSASSTGEALADTILERLCRFGLEPSNLRGQGYDGAANMTGIIKGCKSRILQLYPKALYTHCGAHVLNLSIGTFAASSLRIWERFPLSRCFQTTDVFLLLFRRQLHYSSDEEDVRNS